MEGVNFFNGKSFGYLGLFGLDSCEYEPNLVRWVKLTLLCISKPILFITNNIFFQLNILCLLFTSEFDK